MKILALDYGKARIGVAIGDTSFGIAFARDFIANKDSKKAIEEICKLAKDEQIEKIIIGRPVMLEGSESDSSLAVEDFKDNLEEEISVSIELVDERFSTNIAQQRLNSGLAKNKKKKQLIDSSAAQVILEGYLNRI